MKKDSYVVKNWMLGISYFLAGLLVLGAYKAGMFQTEGVAVDADQSSSISMLGIVGLALGPPVVGLLCLAFYIDIADRNARRLVAVLRKALIDGEKWERSAEISAFIDRTEAIIVGTEPVDELSQADLALLTRLLASRVGPAITIWLSALATFSRDPGWNKRNFFRRTILQLDTESTYCLTRAKSLLKGATRILSIRQIDRYSLRTFVDEFLRSPESACALARTVL